MLQDIGMWLAAQDALVDDVLDVEGMGVGYDSPPPPNARLIADGKFNKDTGTLYLVRVSGEEVPISGFVMPTYLEGPRGRKGNKGKNGKDGKDGRDGNKGCTGCDGNKGATGETGACGETGATGETGPKGKSGTVGNEGPPGPSGVTGARGMMGAKGNRGAGCLTGPVGMIGLKPVEVVVVQTNEPSAINVHMWGEPDVPIYGTDSGDVDRDPKPIEFEITPIELDIKAPSNDSSDGTYFTGTGVSNIIHFTGGVGPFNYEWSGDYTKDDAVTFSVGQRGRALTLTVHANVPPEESKVVEGKLHLKIVDEGHPDRREFTAESFYKFNVVNPSDTDIWDEHVWQPRKGAIVFGVRANLTSGRNVKVEELFLNESLVGLEIDGMTDDWKNWSQDSLTDYNSRRKSTKIVEIVKGQTKSYIQINELKILPDKYVMIQRAGIWTWIQASSVRPDDLIYKKGGIAEGISVLEWKDEEVFTVAIDVEPLDCFFLADYLVHD